MNLVVIYFDSFFLFFNDFSVERNKTASSQQIIVDKKNAKKVVFSFVSIIYDKIITQILQFLIYRKNNVFFHTSNILL